MSWFNGAYAAVLIASAAIAYVVGIVVWQRRRAPGGWPMVAFQVGIFVWSLTYAFHWLSNDPSYAHFWLDMTYIGVLTVPTAFLLFVLQFTFRDRFLTPRRVLLLCVEPVLTLFIMLTNPFHSLFHGSANVVEHLHSFYQGGPWFWVNAAYSFFIIFIGIVLLLFAVGNSRYNYRRQAGYVLLGVFIPLLSTVLTFIGLNPFAELDLTPITFSVSGILFAVALSRYHLLKVVPIARYSLVEGMADGVIVLNDQQKIVDINPAILKMVDGSPAELIGADIRRVFKDRVDISQLCCAQENKRVEVQWRADPLLWIDLQLNPIKGKDGQIDGWLLIWRDITELKQIQEGLRQSEQRYRYLLETAAFPIVVTSLVDNSVLYANPRTIELFELDGYYLGQQAPDFYQDPNERFHLIEEVSRQGKVNDFEVALKTRNGNQIWTNLSANVIEFEGHRAIFVALSDITPRRKVELELRKLQRAVDQSATTIVITDLQGKIEFVNPAFCQTSGYSVEEALGNNPNILKSGEQDPSFYRHLWETISRGENWKGMFHNVRKDGSLYWESATISPIRDTGGKITHYLAVKEDVTRQKEAEEELERVNQELRVQLRQNEELREILREQAIRDPLTNLYNRRYLDETLPREFARAEREHYPISVLMVDIDHFKDFNDIHGHDAGDVVLKSLASLLLDGTRAEDIVARYGGEEILVVLTNTSLEVAIERAEILRAAFEAAETRFEGTGLHATISIGAAEFPESSVSIEGAIRAADQAMYRAKAAGRNCVSR